MPYNVKRPQVVLFCSADVAGGRGMRWFPLKEGYQKRIVWVNVDHVTSVKFATGADGMPMAYMILSTGAEVTTHDNEDLDKLKRILEKNAC